MLYLDGSESEHCSYEAPWQKVAKETEGIGADAFWQWGDSLSAGQTANDNFTIFYGGTEWECLVRDHVAAIEASCN